MATKEEKMTPGNLQYLPLIQEEKQGNENEVKISKSEQKCDVRTLVVGCIEYNSAENLVKIFANNIPLAFIFSKHMYVGGENKRQPLIQSPLIQGKEYSFRLNNGKIEYATKYPGKEKFSSYTETGVFVGGYIGKIIDPFFTLRVDKIGDSEIGDNNDKITITKFKGSGGNLDIAVKDSNTLFTDPLSKVASVTL